MCCSSGVRVGKAASSALRCSISTWFSYGRRLYIHAYLFHGAQLARIVKPLMGPKRHASFENLLGRLKTFLFEALTHFLFLGPALRQFFMPI